MLSRTWSGLRSAFSASQLCVGESGHWNWSRSMSSSGSSPPPPLLRPPFEPLLLRKPLLDVGPSTPPPPPPRAEPLLLLPLLPNPPLLPPLPPLAPQLFAGKSLSPPKPRAFRWTKRRNRRCNHSPAHLPPVTRIQEINMF